MTELEATPDTDGAAASGHGARGARLRAIVLLAGVVRANSLPARLGRSILSLPLGDGVTLLDVWRLRLASLFGAQGDPEALPDVRVLTGHDSPPIPKATDARGPRFLEDRDAGDYRGTAGAIRDLCEEFADDDHVIVGTASQCPDEGLLESLLQAADPAAGVTLSVGLHGEPTGLMLLRCEAIRSVPRLGFMDLKEQALPKIADVHGVRVAESPMRVSQPIRDLRAYLNAARSWSQARQFAPRVTSNPFEERWRPSFAIIESGGEVSAGAHLHDSIVLAGGGVEDGCELVRCVVGTGHIARRGVRRHDELLIGESVSPLPEAAGSGGAR